MTNERVSLQDLAHSDPYRRSLAIRAIGDGALVENRAEAVRLLATARHDPDSDNRLDVVRALGNRARLPQARLVLGKSEEAGPRSILEALASQEDEPALQRAAQIELERCGWSNNKPK